MRVIPLLIAICVFPLIGRGTGANPEIAYLLEFVEKSDARFIRAGSEYSPREAAAHLRRKLARAGARVKTAEDFVNGIASKSYLTGRIYQVKLTNGKVRPAGGWLHEALARYRKRGAAS